MIGRKTSVKKWTKIFLGDEAFPRPKLFEKVFDRPFYISTCLPPFVQTDEIKDLTHLQKARSFDD